MKKILIRVALTLAGALMVLAPSVERFASEAVTLDPDNLRGLK